MVEDSLGKEAHIKIEPDTLGTEGGARMGQDWLGTECSGKSRRTL
jgi:hypothetical protein